MRKCKALIGHWVMAALQSTILFQNDDLPRWLAFLDEVTAGGEFVDFFCGTDGLDTAAGNIVDIDTST